MLQRRKRFQVTIVRAGKTLAKRVCLAYSAAGARALFERQDGTRVLRVEAIKRRKYRKGQAACWCVDWKAVQDACDVLGISWPVKVRRTSSFAHNGAHRLGVVGFRRPVHYITVEKTATCAKATETLWHELAHAAQAERVVRESPCRNRTVYEMIQCWDKHEMRSRKIPYKERPCETEANQIAGIYGERSLTKPV